MEKEIHHIQKPGTDRQFSAVVYRLTPAEAKTAGDKLGNVFKTGLVPSPANDEPTEFLHYGSTYGRQLEELFPSHSVTIFQRTTLQR